MNMISHVRISVEIFDDGGPTGDFAEATRVAVRDYGNNTYWEGPAEQYDPAHHSVKLPTRLVATEIKVPGPGEPPIGSSDFVCNYLDA